MLVVRSYIHGNSNRLKPYVFTLKKIEMCVFVSRYKYFHTNDKRQILVSSPFRFHIIILFQFDKYGIFLVTFIIIIEGRSFNIMFVAGSHSR